MADRPVWRALLSLLSMPVVILATAFFYLPVLLVWRALRAAMQPENEKLRRRTEQAAKRNAQHMRIEAAIRAELIAHRLPDTLENRARLGALRRAR